MRGRYAVYALRISDGRALSATGRLLRPAGTADARRFPAVLLQDGRELNSRAIDYLPAEFGDIVVLSLDYPEEIPYTLGLRDLLARREQLRGAARRIAPSFSLAASYLASRHDVDSARLAMVATSFAVPFAVRAAASDERFANVALIYGAGDMAAVVAANLATVPRWLRRPIASIVVRPFQEFAPERVVSGISPRPLVMINGSDDPQMPRRGVLALYHEAREPKKLIWLRTGHLMPDDSALIRVLVDSALSNLPVLAATARP